MQTGVLSQMLLFLILTSPRWLEYTQLIVIQTVVMISFFYCGGYIIYVCAFTIFLWYFCAL